MKKIILILLLLVTATVTYVYATATTETNDKRAIPVTLYGKTSGGAFVKILTDASGVVQTTT